MKAVSSMLCLSSSRICLRKKLSLLGSLSYVRSWLVWVTITMRSVTFQEERSIEACIVRPTGREINNIWHLEWVQLV